MREVETSFTVVDRCTEQALDYGYYSEEDRDDDCIKLYHYVVSPNQDEDTMDWSPYSTPTVEDLILWVELGMPSRVTGAPLDHKDLQGLKAEHAKDYGTFEAWVTMMHTPTDDGPDPEILWERYYSNMAEMLHGDN